MKIFFFELCANDFLPYIDRNICEKIFVTYVVYSGSIMIGWSVRTVGPLHRNGWNRLELGDRQRWWGFFPTG
jgi:hypothetical protein